MQAILARKTVSMTELREPAKVIAQAGNQPVAIMNRNQVVGYFVPTAAIEPDRTTIVTDDELTIILKKRRPVIAATLKYLEDK